MCKLGCYFIVIASNFYSCSFFIRLSSNWIFTWHFATKTPSSYMANTPNWIVCLVDKRLRESSKYSQILRNCQLLSHFDGCHHIFITRIRQPIIPLEQINAEGSVIMGARSAAWACVCHLQTMKLVWRPGQRRASSARKTKNCRRLRSSVPELRDSFPRVTHVHTPLPSLTDQCSCLFCNSVCRNLPSIVRVHLEVTDRTNAVQLHLHLSL